MSCHIPTKFMNIFHSEWQKYSIAAAESPYPAVPCRAQSSSCGDVGAVRVCAAPLPQSCARRGVPSHAGGITSYFLLTKTSSSKITFWLMKIQ